MPADAATYVFLINSLIPGGAERSLVELLPPLEERGIHPIVLVLNDREIGFQQEVIDKGHDLRFVRSRNLAGRVREVRALLRREKPSLLHTALFDADIVGRLAAVATGVPVISTLANTTYDERRVAHDENLSKAKLAAVKALDGFTARHFTDHFHAVSEAVKASAVASLRLDPAKVTVVRRGRDPERLGRRTPDRRARVRDELGMEESEIVLTVGRHEYQKGQVFLIEAFARLAAKRPGAILVIAGRDGNATADLRSRAQELGVSDRVAFLGHRGDVADLMAAADVFVFPSLWEGLGGVLIEALALELPIITSDLPATREVIGEDGTSGIVVPPGDADALALELERVLADPDHAAALSSGTRKRFEGHFLLEDRSSEMMDLLVSVAR